MNNLKLVLKPKSISTYTRNSSGTYDFVVDLLKSNGTPIDNPNLPNKSTVSNDWIDERFILNVGIVNGDYSVPGITINVSHNGVLVATRKGYTLVNTSGETGEPGDYKYLLITKGLPEHLDVVLSDDGEYVIINDLASSDVKSPYEFRYLAGAEVIKQGTPLKNYKFAANNGMWIVKFKTKIGLDTINRWEDVGDGNTYYDKDAGQSFSWNSTAGVQTGVFVKNQVQGGFKQQIPSNYKPESKMPQWADIAPNLKLPNGHMFFLNRGDWSIEQVLQKGVTHISHYQIPRPNGDESYALELKEKGITYNDVPVMPQIFNLPDTGIDNWVNGYNTRYWVNGPLSDEEAISQAKRHVWLDALWIGETMEGNYYMPVDKHMWVPFYKQLKKQYQEKFGSRNIPWYICHNYFMPWPTQYNLGQESSKQEYKDLLRLPLDKMPRSNFSPGGSLSETTLIMEAVYPGAPDIQQSSVLDTIYKMNVIRKLGYEAGIFLSSVFEYKPNNHFENVFEDGKYYEQGKIPLDPNLLIAFTFYSQRWGKVFVEWGGPGKVNGGRIFNSKTFEPTLWYKNGSTTPDISSKNPDTNDIFKYISSPNFHHAKDGGIGYYGYSGGTDLASLGEQLYADTWGKLESGKEQFLKFRIDNGNWISPENKQMDDVVNARYDKRGLVDSISLNGEICWNYQNCFGDNKWHNIDVELPNGRIVSERVSGNGIHVKVQSL